MDTALIGCGFIGTFIAEQVAFGGLPFEIKMLLDRNKDKIENIQGMFSEKPIAVEDIKEITSSDVSLVIEAASIRAVRAFAQPILSSGKDMMIMSVGAFAISGFYEKIEKLCRKNKVNIYLPSGAIGGLDTIRAASSGRLSNVELTTTKHPRALEGAPYIVEGNIDLSSIKKRQVIFNGNALEAIKGFPANVNVAVAISLAGLGAEKTKVKIIADPDVTTNIHEISAKGDFGGMMFRTENLPSKNNPKTSLLAALSAVSTLRRIAHPIKVG